MMKTIKDGINMNKYLIYFSSLAISLFCLGFASIASADNNECPVGLVSSSGLDDEFGLGALDLTRCLSRRHNAKIIIQINQFCHDAVPNVDCTRPYALLDIRNMIKDYEVTHAMEQGKDYEIAAVVHASGTWQVLKDEGFDGYGDPVSNRNQFEDDMIDLIDNGVKFYVSLNSVRGFISKKRLPPVTNSLSGATGELIEGVAYVTDHITAIADFQSKGYIYVQP